ncbi:MAG TPA: response regulator [Nitrososphaera sp.]|nr:response regulator [Nitrososphaera sp.]
MVVDDEIDILTIIRRILEKWEFEVDTFSNPLNAHEVFKNTHKRYALVLIDLRMPEINGIALAVMLRRIRKDIKIMIMTAYDISIKDIQADVPDLKPLSLLRKPFVQKQICDAVKNQVQVPS